MPIVDPEVIKSGEKELFSSIIASFDKYQIEKLFQDSHDLLLKEQMQFKEGKTVAHNNQIAYQLVYETNAIFSILIDRAGNHIRTSIDNNEITMPRGNQQKNNQRKLEYAIAY